MTIICENVYVHQKPWTWMDDNRHSDCKTLNKWMPKITEKRRDKSILALRSEKRG